MAQSYAPSPSRTQRAHPMPALRIHEAILMRWKLDFIFSVISFLLIGILPIDAPLAEDAGKYEQLIKPLLQHKCVSCHGALEQSGNLRLDAGTLMLSGGDSGSAIVPGNSSDSLLLQRVTSTDTDLRMPPEGEGEPLTAAQVQQLKNWIDQGALFPTDEVIPEDPAEFWSYKPITSPALPQISNAPWARNPIDVFIAAQHELHNLQPRPEAHPATWLRRVYLDLIGIPPTRDELHQFLCDSSPTSYEKVVDQLLQRPEYGQRWGRHWMDVWRYSDWYGSRGGNEIRYSQRHLWRWRDWIVQSLIDDKPYDEMIVAMLAGDELDPTNRETLTATGYLGRNWYKFDRNVWLFDTVEHTSQAFLAMTMRCARCHNHKYDPITQQDYYQFRAFFEPHDVRTDPLSADPPKEKDATLGMVLSDGIARVFDKHLAAETFLFHRGDDRTPDKSSPLSPGVPQALGNAAIRINPISLPVESYYQNLQEPFLSGLLASAENSVTEARQRFLQSQEQATTAEKQLIDLQNTLSTAAPLNSTDTKLLNEDFSTQSASWSVISGDWAWEDGKLIQRTVSNFATLVANKTLPRNFKALVKYRTLPGGTYRSVGFSFDYLDQGNSQDIYTSANDTASSIQAFHRQAGKQEYPPAGIVQTSIKVGEVVTVEAIVKDQQLTLLLDGKTVLEYTMPVPRHDGRFALWVHDGSAEFIRLEIDALKPTIEDLQRQHRTAINAVNVAEQEVAVAAAELISLRARIAAEQAKYLHNRPDHQSLALVAGRAEQELAVAKASLALTKETDEEKHAALRQTLAEAQAAMKVPTEAYSPLGEIYPSTSSGRRLALARWIASPDNPRTARVAVNHIWLRHFGEAIVPSVANFGLNGQTPSHPQLLDWLSSKLIADDWQMKPLHRMIVLSATYRQSSAVGTETQSPRLDPTNRYLWRMNSRRMEAEVVRDSLLFLSSAIDGTFGGPEIPESQGQTSSRRSIYFRNTPNEKMLFLETFDNANPNECYRRQESVVPHQSLAMMNSSLSLDQARRLASILSGQCGNTDDDATNAAFIVAAWETILCRPPTSNELIACQQFLIENTVTARSADLPTFTANNQPSSQAPSTIPSQRARENLIHVLFSHNDFVTIR